MFRKLRIAFLLYVLLFVAAATFLAHRRATDWDEPLWVNMYTVPASAHDDLTAGSALDATDVASIENFFAAQARAHGVALERPFRLHAAGSVSTPLPPLPQPGSVVGAILWSLQMRWIAAKLDWLGDAPAPDIVLFVVAHDPSRALAAERSGALRKGLIAVANVIAERAAAGGNRVVVAHELLHTLGATDKYDPATNLPLHPHGYAEPDRMPLYPQRKAELMGGRVPLAPSEAAIPRDLGSVVVGPATAIEIGWKPSTAGGT